MTEVEIREVRTKQDYKDFVQVQFDIYKDNAYWVPPIKKDEIKVLQPEFNPAFRFCQAKFWLAFKNNKCVGRIGAIVNNKCNEKHNRKNGRFSRFEFIDDVEVSKKLYLTASEWLKEQGMETIQGPLGFTNLDHQGMLVEGFDQLPSAVSEYHLPYYKDHLVDMGFEKEVDWIEFRLFLEGIPDKVKRVSELMRKRNGFTVKSFTKSSELLPFSHKLFEILNTAFKDLFSVVELDKEMIDYYVNRYITLLNPKFVKMIENKEGEMIAFIIVLPSLSEALQKAKGKLFPFGWYHLSQALKKPKVVDLMLTGVLPAYQGKGATAILMNEIQSVMEEHNVTEVETTGVFETNIKVVQNWKNYKHIQHKRKRCWKKAL